MPKVRTCLSMKVSSDNRKRADRRDFMFSSGARAAQMSSWEKVMALGKEV